MELKNLLAKPLVRRGVYTGAVIFIIAAVAYWKVGAAAPEIATYTAERGEFIIDIRETGELRAKRSMSVFAPRNVRSSLQIIDMTPEGIYVKKGDFLVQFDTSQVKQKVEEQQNALDNAENDLKSQTASQESNMAQIRSELESQRYSYEQAEIRLQQMQYEAEAKRREYELSMKKAKIAYDQARNRIGAQKKIDAANIRKLKAKIEQARLKLRQARDELNNLTLIAPQDGLVVFREIWGPSGREKVKVGDSPWRGQEVVGIPDLSTMLVKTQVKETDVSRIRKGQEVIIKLDAVPEPTFYGTITSVATLAQRGSNSNIKTFDLDVTIEGTDPVLKPGMTASCRIITDRIADVVSIPFEAVFEEEGKTVVYKEGSGLKLFDVTVGDKNSNFIIISEGVSEGDVVFLRNPTLPLEELGKTPPNSEHSRPTRPSQQNRVVRIRM